MSFDDITVHIADVVGPQYLLKNVDGKKEAGYDQNAAQYASSTYQTSRDLQPGLIVKAATLEDIQRVVREARRRNVAVAVRSGGHQYSGASSTGPNNILLDLSQTFKGPLDLVYLEKKDGMQLVLTSVSHRLQEFISFLQNVPNNETPPEKGFFVPTGQCMDVGLGGHIQTGGYGQLLRSFGLLADHVTALKIVDQDGNTREITKENDKDMFFALLGGSPGNFGILTHAIIQVHSDKDYQGSLGVRAVFPYTMATLSAKLRLLVQMSDKGDFPPNFDLCVNVLSSIPKDGYPGMDQEMRDYIPQDVLDEYYESKNVDASSDKGNENELVDIAHEDADIQNIEIRKEKMYKIPLIVIYAQWVKMKPTDDSTEAIKWMNELRTYGIMKWPIRKLPMSQMVTMWQFTPKREYPFPYIKRTLLTNSNTLEKDRWPDLMAKHFHQALSLLKVDTKGLNIASQMQCFGGAHVTNADNGTCHSWRKDTTFGMTCDVFYEDGKLQAAQAWQQETDAMIGPTGKFAKQFRVPLWGSFGEWDMDGEIPNEGKVWQRYYESEAMYERLRAIRTQADQYGIFTPNPFCVSRLLQKLADKE